MFVSLYVRTSYPVFLPFIVKAAKCSPHRDPSLEQIGVRGSLLSVLFSGTVFVGIGKCLRLL